MITDQGTFAAYRTFVADAGTARVVSDVSSQENHVVFKKMLGALGIGGPSVDTVLSQPGAQPGG